MATEVLDRHLPPYAWTTLLTATFADGTSWYGTGALVGRNDILTATHVLYDPDRGGWATNVEVHPGVDFSGSLQRFESAPLVSVDDFTWQMHGWPTQTFSSGSNLTLTFAETQHDVAILGLSTPIGDTLGWFGLAPGYDTPQWAYQIGYPREGTGMMAGTTWVTRESSHFVYSSHANNNGDILGAGSSGGPLYVLDRAGNPLVIGVKSSGSSASSHWADIGLLAGDLQTAIAANDAIIAMTRHIGTAGADAWRASDVRERFEGGAGTDSVVFDGARGAYDVARHGAEHRVTTRAQPSDTDELAGIERLRFADGTLALDIGIGETAGQAYRIYRAAFDRTPDNDGLKYWIGDLDGGVSIKTVAAGFYASAEFRSLYGADPTNAELVTAFYANTLGREPDAPGFDYWMRELEAGGSRSEMLVSFSESAENYSNTVGLIDDGIWLT